MSKLYCVMQEDGSEVKNFKTKQAADKFIADYARCYPDRTFSLQTRMVEGELIRSGTGSWHNAGEWNTILNSHR